MNGEIAEPIEPIPFGVARKVSEGDAATVVTWSAAVPVATKGVELLAAEGIKVDLLDLRTIWPWDGGGGDRIREEDQAAARGA